MLVYKGDTQINSFLPQQRHRPAVMGNTTHITQLHTSSHLDFNTSPELTNLLLSDLGVSMPNNDWITL